MRSLARPLLLTSFFLGLFVRPVTARTWHISPDGAGDAPTIQAGIDSAAVGDTVLVACGTYHEHDIAMKSGVCLRSATGEPECAAVDADGQGRVILCDSVDETGSIEGLTIRGGRLQWPENGAGVSCMSSSLRITGCEFIDNLVVVGMGGGIYCRLSNVSVTRTTFRENFAYAGGGLFCDQSPATVVDCAFESNSASDGGGICCQNSDVLIANCRLSGNATTGSGGGMFIERGSPRIDSCRFSGNTTAHDGGAVTMYDATPEFVGCVLDGNSGGRYGGGMCCDDSYPLLTRCTLYGNSASWLGGGGMYAASSTLTLVNSMICFSTGGRAICCGGSGSSAQLFCCNLYGNTGGNWSVSCTYEEYSFSANPLFCGAEQGDFTLRSDSPCLPGNHPEGEDCGVIGAFGEGCSAPTAVERTSWGGVKRVFR